MKKINLEQKSLEIQNIISRYTKESFVCFFADFIRHHPERRNTGFSEKFKSKLKDSLYLIMLRLSTPLEGKEELRYSKESDLVLQQVADILLEIVSFYLSENYDEFDEITDKRQRLLVHELAFKNYFQNGILNYREQEINKVIRMFKPYQDKTQKRLGIDLKTLIDLCTHSELIYRAKSINSKSFILDKKFDKLARQSANGLLAENEFADKLLELSDETQESFLNFFENPHQCLLFTKQDFLPSIEEKYIDIFCDLFSIDIKDTHSNLFYSQQNPLENKPIIKISNNKYLNIYQKQLPSALYDLLYTTLTQTKKEKEQLNFRKGKVVLENHTLELFKKFFKKSKRVSFFTNYYINNHPEEKDILIIADKNAYIIECKASRYREPRRDTEQAYQRIKSDFADCIQKGYDQCYQVEQELINNEKVVIAFKGKSEVILRNDIHEIFSIVVTSERFASIQTDLGLLLKKDNADPYPWSIYVDDLETFLKAIYNRFSNPSRKIFEFLEHRELLHKRLITNDELDVCAMFLQNPKHFKELCESEYVVFTDPTLQNYFDKLYFDKKLKFKIEDY
ncbi:nuclease-like protein [Jejuia pallidilutea]|uniref:Nuclease-like protein n=1 Tax=Jejuia pallidilutea TaxID=504487 RepID=A0A362XCI3_9FLAO|nr:NERD domain-containing protein [Jejuia pallidilutea]PQV48823.1 nuclease-like protein [Jejuia pallidilutea]